MKLKTLDGPEVIVNLRQSKYPIKDIDTCKSALQYRVGQQLQEVLRRRIILEEFGIPGSRLSCDFFVPSLMLVVEADGAQHGKFVKHYHGDIQGFRRSLKNDKAKERWCKMNGITLIRVTSSEAVAEAIKNELY